MKAAVAFPEAPAGGRESRTSQSGDDTDPRSRGTVIEEAAANPEFTAGSRESNLAVGRRHGST